MRAVYLGVDCLQYGAVGVHVADAVSDDNGEVWHKDPVAVAAAKELLSHEPERTCHMNQSAPVASATAHLSPPTMRSRRYRPPAVNKLLRESIGALTSLGQLVQNVFCFLAQLL